MPLSDEERALLRDIQRDLHDHDRKYQTLARRFARALVVSTFVLAVVAIALPVATRYLHLDLITIVNAVTRDASKDKHLPAVTWHDMAEVEIWGAVGALVSWIVAIRSGVRPRAGDEGLSVSQLALKLPAGSLTAAFAVLLVQADVVPVLRSIDPRQVGAYSVLFGFAQEAVTRLIDRQAASLLEKSAKL